jgi:hypothetical protein
MYEPEPSDDRTNSHLSLRKIKLHYASISTKTREMKVIVLGGFFICFCLHAGPYHTVTLCVVADHDFWGERKSPRELVSQ